MTARGRHRRSGPARAEPRRWKSGDLLQAQPRQAERGTSRLRGSPRRHPDDPGRRHDGAARGLALLLYPPAVRGQADFINGSADLPHGDRLDEILEFRREQALRHPGELADGPPVVGHPLRDQGIFPRRLPRFLGRSRPWGDFDWLFGAAQSTCKVLEDPIHYEGRCAGQSKMKCCGTGCVLLKACWAAFWRIKYPCGSVAVASGLQGSLVERFCK